MRLPNFRLQALPGVFVNTGLPKNPSEKFPPDISLMRIGNSNGKCPIFHELVFPARIRPYEPQLPEVANQVFAFDGSERRHQATSLIVSSIP